MILALAGMLSFTLVGCGSDDDEVTIDDARELAGDNTDMNDLIDAIEDAFTDTE